MIPIHQLSVEEAQSLEGLLFDLDDTVLDHGELTEQAYSSLFRLREAGFDLWAVTGRPQGWGSVIARQWPVSGVIAENGAIASFRDGTRIHTLDPLSPQQRAQHRARLVSWVSELRQEFPELCPADDVAARHTDFAFDINEYERVPASLVGQVISRSVEQGLRAWTSSVHLHVTADGEDKATGTLKVLGAIRNVAPTRAPRVYAYIGDSENDVAGFAAFHTSIGVANLSPTVSVKPRFLTHSSRGAGFAEAARTLIARRAGQK